jgi:hypothetical protein
MTDVRQMFNYCRSLKTLPAMNFSSATLATNFADYCENLEWSDITGMTTSHGYAYCNLSAAALNNIYTKLPTYTPPPNVYMTAAGLYPGNSNYILYTMPTAWTIPNGTTVYINGFSNANYNFPGGVAAYLYGGNQFYVYRAYNAGSPGTLGYLIGGGGSTITVTGNPGVSGDNPSIATSKGWTVTG